MAKDKKMVYITSSTKSKTFNSKPVKLKKLINEALHIIETLGVPLNDKTPRSLERMAMAFLAVLDVKSTSDWKNAKDLHDNYSITSREIIIYWNSFFNENVLSGSYDDIRRKNLDLIVLANIITRTKPDSARNDPSRGYALNSEFIGQTFPHPNFILMFFT